MQETLWGDCTDAYYFGLTNTKSVSTDLCFYSKDGSINIQALEQHIVLGMVNWLAKIGDINQHQKICIDNLHLLPKRPSSWGDIKNGNFFIVNGQHSMEASKFLKDMLSCSERQNIEVVEWDAYIIWSNDKNQLQSIFEFYNIYNGMGHAVATLRTTIISARMVWFNFGRPQPSQSNIDLRQNDGIVLKENLEVKNFFIDNLSL